MSVLTPKRLVFLALVVFLGASAFANTPSNRANARMAFDEKDGVGVLFGGRGQFDGATQLIHDTDETWFWNGTRFLQVFPQNRPPQRNSHTMVYDTKRQRVVMFGGRRETNVVKGDPTLFNDTWVWQNQNWTKVDTTSAPSVRQNAGMAYDVVNDRIVLFGGQNLDVDANPKAIYDTWEFDGTTWAQVGASGTPLVAKPLLAYDAERKEIIMVGVDGTDLSVVQYRYDGAAKTWTKLSPAAKPACANEGSMVYQTASQKLLFTGGICTTGTSPLDEIYEWDGTTWTKITTTNAVVRSYAQAVTYDSIRQNVILFGGSDLGATNVTSGIILYANGTFRFPDVHVRPDPRSLAGFQTDPVSGNIWLFGGLFQDGSTYLNDFWGYRSQQWFPLTLTDGPTSDCPTPLAAYDSDRSRLVLTCSGSTVNEWDSGTRTWKTPTLTKPPEDRRFANMVYDRKLKKTVMFGGYNNAGNYLNETWTWDGTTWTQVKTKTSDAPNNRGLMSMWYDPLAEKTIVYGGLGRATLNESITRYSDMWSFDGTKWTKMTVTTTPGQRLGAQLTVVPTTGKVLLFGGLVAELVDPENPNSLTQTFFDDTWEWDGKASSWTKLSPARSPDVRENGMMAWDPLANEIVLFGGYSYGFYHSDVWAWNGLTWRPLADPGNRRRRTAGSPALDNN